MEPKPTRTQQTFAVLFCALFFLSCAFFSLGMLIPGAAETAEGGQMPRLIENGQLSPTWRDDFENWFSRHFAYRDVLVDAFSALREHVFHTGNEQVIVGREGFLFYADTVPGYCGTDPMTDAELEAAADALANLARYAESRGAAFVFLCAPNKNTIYPEMMPATVVRSDAPSDLDRLLPLLSARGVTAVDVRDALTAAKSDGPVYQKRDSHWNGEGARIAVRQVLDAAGVPIPACLAAPCTKAAADLEADLEALLYPHSPAPDVRLSPEEMPELIYAPGYAAPMDINITVTNEAGSGSVLVFRDSFANAMIPLVSAAFGESRFSRALPFRIDSLDTAPADLVIVEIAERSLRNLISADAKTAP